MIKIKHVKYDNKEIITDEYDNIIFTIEYNGYYINFIADKDFGYSYLTADEKDTIIAYLMGIKVKYSYQFNVYLVFSKLYSNEDVFAC